LETSTLLIDLSRDNTLMLRGEIFTVHGQKLWKFGLSYKAILALKNDANTMHAPNY
jgi:hypothetical protein